MPLATCQAPISTLCVWTRIFKPFGLTLSNPSRFEVTSRALTIVSDCFTSLQAELDAFVAVATSSLPSIGELCV